MCTRTPRTSAVSLWRKTSCAWVSPPLSPAGAAGVKINEAIEELLTVAREAKIRAERSHIKLSGPTAWGKTADVLDLLDKARAEGLEITHDQYVYTASSTGLAQLIPDTAFDG